MAKKPSKPQPSSELQAGDYLRAAEDHAAALAPLYSHGDYALVLYVSGLATECLFRAFRAKHGLPFRPDHPLAALATEAGFPDLVPDQHREGFDAALTNVVLRWRNNHRFRSNDATRRFLKGHKLDRGIRGDFLKENARLISSSAVNLINLGVRRWR